MQYVVIDRSIFSRGPNFFKWPVPLRIVIFFFSLFCLVYFSFVLCCFDALGLRTLGKQCHGLFENHRVSYVLALII